MRSVFQFERQALAFLAGVKNGHASCQRNLGRAFVKDFSLQMNGALDGFVGHGEFQVGALHGVGNGRRVQFSDRLAREFEQPVVFVERKGDVTRRWDGR